MAGNLATKLYLYTGDAMRRRKIVQGLFGTAAGTDAAALSETLGGLKQFEAVFSNQQYAPYTALRVTTVLRANLRSTPALSRSLAAHAQVPAGKARCLPRQVARCAY